jgi:hypothetical protein
MPVKATLILLTLVTLISPVTAQQNKADSLLKYFTIRGEWFIAHQWLSPNQNNDAFKLKRGYLTVESRFNQVFSARYTQDITIDDEGDDAGNVELRFKYCYLKANLPSFSAFTQSFVEVGLVHRPWIDFEEHINDFRVQSEMFLERAKIINSADFGFTYVTLLGGKMNADYQQSVSSSYPGKYGSISVGVYNGAGYHALEKNNNKTVEGRFTLRPFPEKLPGLQLSYNMAIGKGNDSLSTDFRLNSFFLSYESHNLVLTAQYYSGRGNMSGSSPEKHDGYSFFGEFRIPRTKFMLFSRYDYLNPRITNAYRIAVGGFGYRFFKQNKILFDIDWSDMSSVKRIYEIALDIRF